MPVDSASLLRWYDAHARTLPWRLPPGSQITPDTYRVWLAEVMLQQTTVAAVTGYFARFIARWPTVDALAAASDADVMQAWAGLGYYARARHLLACARAVVAAGGWPRTEAGLRELPGLGAYTAASVAAIAFGQAATVVDGNVERVLARAYAIATPMPQARAAIRAHAGALTPSARPGDHAQALMDLGATVCRPRAPACHACPWNDGCAARAQGNPEAYPVKAPKPPRRTRTGTAFWLTRADTVLLVTRPPRGLFGGMRALPTGPWVDHSHPTLDGAPMPASWQMLGAVRHGFTHFDLTLHVAAASCPADAQFGDWWPVDDLPAAGLPTLFARAATLAASPPLCLDLAA